MTSTQIRQSFLDFFKSKQHTIVPSSSLMPDSPNLLFTNAGMNQFVPIFLGQVKCPYSPGRAADTQKCIRAGGKHNDLDDVGLDTYHHTFFEMLGNWSFGDYFKKEAIDWAWELITGVWRFPKNRLYATVYSPDQSKGDPSDFDQEAYDLWAAKFTAAGLDPKVHIVHGNKKDNFWMMGETGPCGPCSELHVDLTPQGDTRGALVNKGDARCMEIWNLVFIQFNANPDGTFSPLPARHVDTGMGFERVTSIIQCTKNFTDFTGTISNYETDIFRPIFDEIEKLSGKKYGSTLPSPMGSTGDSPVPLGDPPGRLELDLVQLAIAHGERVAVEAARPRVPDGISDQADVRRAIERDRRVQPGVLVAAFTLEQRAPELVLQMQVGRGRENQDRHVRRPRACSPRDVEHRIDVGGHRAAHRKDVERLSDPACLLRFEDPLQRDAIALRRDRKRDVHDVDADIGEQRGEFQFLFGRERDARHLLAVAQRIVVEHDRRRIREPEMRRVGLRLPGERVQRLAQVDHDDITGRRRASRRSRESAPRGALRARRGMRSIDTPSAGRIAGVARRRRRARGRRWP